MILKQIPVENIQCNPKQPRKSISGIPELAENINEIGLINPISVEIKGKEKYQIICGERRWMAFKHLKKKRIPAIITKSTPYKMMAENLARQELNLIEKVDGCAEVLKSQVGKDWKKAVTHVHNKAVIKHYNSQDEKAEKICKAIGINPHTLYVSLPVLELDKSTKKIIFQNRDYFTDGVILKLARMKEKNLVLKTAKGIADGQMTSKEAHRYVSNTLYESVEGMKNKFWFRFVSRWDKNSPSVRILLEEFLNEGEIPKEYRSKFIGRVYELNKLSKKVIDKDVKSKTLYRKTTGTTGKLCTKTIFCT